MGFGADYYEQIARSISGINKQMNVNSMRADAREARGLQQLLTASQLQTQGENRGLNQRAADRADKRLEETIAANDFTRKMQIAGEARAKTTALQQAKNFEAEEGIRKEKLAKAKQQHTPVPLNINNFVNNNPRMQGLLARPEMSMIVESVYGGSDNVKFNAADGSITNRVTGEPIMMSPFNHANKYYAAIDGAIKTALDPQAVIRGDITQLSGMIADTESKLKKLTPTGKGVDRFIKESAELKVQLNKLKGQLDRRQNVTIDEKISMYEDQANRMTTRYQKALQDGIRPELDLYFKLGLQRNATMQDRLFKDKQAQIKVAGDDTAKTPKGVGVQEWGKVLTFLEHEYYTMDEKGQFVKTKAGNQRFNYASQLIEQALVAGESGIGARNKAVELVKERENLFWKAFDKQQEATGDSLQETYALMEETAIGRKFREVAGYIPTLTGYKPKERR